jgi:curved DNA-binding protein CbpA
MSNGKLTAILLNLHKDRRSGVLRIGKRLEKKQLVLDSGSLAFAESGVQGDHLAKVMIEQRLLQPRMLREVVFEMKKGRTCEEVLLATPAVKPQDIAKGVREQALNIMASLWRWDDYELNFYPGEQLISRKIRIGLALPEAIIFSARRAVEKRLYLAPRNFLEGRFTTSGGFLSGSASEIPFDDTESSVLVSLQKPLHTVDLMTKVASRTGNPEESILVLAAIGLIRFQSPDEIVLDASDSDAMLRLLEDVIYRLDTATHYEILSVARNVGPDELQSAYHKMARMLHPDRFQSKEFAPDVPQKAQKAFAAVNEAYFVLKDPISREVYDEQLANAQNPGGDKLSEDEKMAETFFQNGRASIAKREFEKAVEQLKGSVWICPKNANYNLYLGIAEMGIPKLRRDAEKHLLQALELDAGSLPARLELAKLYIDAQLPRKAEPYLRQILEQDPEHRQAQKLLGKITA